MSIQINILDNGEGVEIKASGIVYGKDIINAHKEIYNEEHLIKQKYHIIDKSKCTEYDVSSDDIKFMASLDRAASLKNPQIIIAIIESEVLEFSLSSLWQAHVDDFIFKTKTFTDREHAMSWISDNKPT